MTIMNPSYMKNARNERNVIFRGMSPNFRGMSSNIPGNIAKHSQKCPPAFWEMFSNIMGNVAKHWGIFWNIPGNVLKHSRECSQTFQGTFQKIRGNLNFGLFREILHVFYQTLLLNCYKTKEKTHPSSPISEQIFWKFFFYIIT